MSEFKIFGEGDRVRERGKKQDMIVVEYRKNQAEELFNYFTKGKTSVKVLCSWKDEDSGETKEDEFDENLLERVQVISGKKENFVKGDFVRERSTERTMIVVKNKADFGGTIKVLCSWEDEDSGETKEDEFYQNNLERVPKNKKFPPS